VVTTVDDPVPSSFNTPIGLMMGFAVGTLLGALFLKPLL
jgi:hypothetical protein